MAGWLRREHEVYAHLRGSFMPRLEGFEDDPEYPVLVLEDLSDADWEVHWHDVRVAGVRSALAELAISLAPPSTRPVREAFAGLFGRWHVVAEDPGPFLSTQIRSEAWLERALPTLLAATDRVRADGEDLLHLDVRSDNLCFRDGHAILVDWNSMWRRGCRASHVRAGHNRGKSCRARATTRRSLPACGRQPSDCRRRRRPRRSERDSAASSWWLLDGASGSSGSRRMCNRRSQRR